MANLKNITELPVAESADGLNLIVNDNGAAKQVPADAIGKVKTINGFEPDENGNIEVVSNWNDLQDKPFYDENSIIEKIHCFAQHLHDPDEQNEEFEFFETTVDGNQYFNICSNDLTNQTVFIIDINGVEYEDVITYWEEGHSYMGVHAQDVSSDHPYSIVFLLDEYDSVHHAMRSIALHSSILQAENIVKIYRKETQVREKVKQIEAKYLPYDLLFEYSGDIEQFDPSKLKYSLYEIQNAIEKLKNGEFVRTLFRWNYHQSYEEYHDMYYGEYPMTLSINYNDITNETDVWAQASIPFEMEGYVLGRISIHFNEDGVSYIGGEST